MANKKNETATENQKVFRTKIYSPEYSGFLDEAPQEVIDKINPIKKNVEIPEAEVILQEIVSEQ